MLKMNYSDFKKKNYSQIVKECERRNINTINCRGNDIPMDDLIGKIIAYDAYYEGRNDVLNERPSKVDTRPENNRRKYCLRCEGADPYYLKLTPDQYDFLRWCINQEIWLPHAEVDEISEIIWETP